MKNLCKIIFLISILSINVNAQPVMWMRYYNPTGSIDKGIDVIENYDSSYVLLSNTSNGICLIKTNKYGQIIWQKFLGDTLDKSSNSIQLTSDSGYVIAGGSGSKYNAMQLIKSDKKGNIIWIKRYTRMGVVARAFAVKVTDDKGFILCGDVYNEQEGFKAYIVKTDSLGNMQWDNIYNSEGAYDIIQSADKNYFSADSYLFRNIDSSGKEIWTRPTGGAIKIVQSKDGYLYLAGGQGQFVLAKFDTSGNNIFQNKYFSKAYGSCMCLTKDSNILLAGGILTDTGNLDIAYTKINQSGDAIFSKFINLHGMTSEIILNVKSTFDNGLIMIGITDYPSGGDFDDNILAIKTDSLGNTSSLVFINGQSQNVSNSFYLSQNYPNPFNPKTTIKYTIPKTGLVTLKIYDVLGKEIMTLVNETIAAGNYEVEFNGSNLSSGVYFYRIESGEFISIKKMILIR